jgi:hypothetical protein
MVTTAVVLPVVQDTLGPVPIVPQVVAHVHAVDVRAVANPSARLLQGLLSHRRGAISSGARRKTTRAFLDMEHAVRSDMRLASVLAVCSMIMILRPVCTRVLCLYGTI